MNRLLAITALALCIILAVTVACALQDARGETKTKDIQKANEDLPVEVDSSTSSYEGKRQWNVRIRRGDREVSLDSINSDVVYYSKYSESGSGVYMSFILDENAPRLDFDKLPGNKGWYAKDCVDIAASALKADKTEGTLLPIAIPILNQIIGQHFILDDTFSGSSITYNSHYKYVGSDKLMLADYSDPTYRLSIEETSKGLVLTFHDDNGSYSATVEVADRKLAATARYDKKESYPDSVTLIEAMRKAIFRASQAVAASQPNTMFDDTELLSKATAVFEKREAFDSYKLAEKVAETSS